MEKKTDFRTDVLPLKDKLFRLALRITLNRHEAEDIVQDTLVRVWERRSQWDEIENMEAYCLTICRRLCIDYVRSRESNASAQFSPLTAHAQEIPAPESQPDEMLDLKQRTAAVRRLIDQLPEVQRTIIQLRDIEGMRYDEIAQVTGLSETQVKVYLHRARKKIIQQA